MKALVLLLLPALLVGCRSRSDSAGSQPAAAPGPLDPAYIADIDNLCHAEERSGADDRNGPRAIAIAMWLGETIQTDAARDFLAALSRAQPANKAALLKTERDRVGLADCPLATTWGG